MDFKKVALAISIATVIATVMARYVQLRERFTPIRMSQQLVESEYQIEKIREEINKALQQQIAEMPQKIENASMEQKFKNLEKTMQSIQQQTVGLRQAINPSKPEEILAIAG